MKTEISKELDPIKLEHWFSMNEKHEKNKTIVNVIKYQNIERVSFKDTHWRMDREWFLILTREKCWIWQLEKQALIPVQLEEIKYFHNRKDKEYRSFDEIIRNYLVAPHTLCELTKTIVIPDSVIESLSPINEFYLGTWVQHSFS